MKESVVAARFAATGMIGRKVLVRTQWNESAPFEAELVAVMPVGRDYAAHLTVDGRARVVALRAVLEIAEV